MEEQAHENVFFRHVDLLRILGVTIPAKGTSRGLLMKIWYIFVIAVLFINAALQGRSMFLPTSLSMKSITLVFFLVNLASALKLLLVQLNAEMLAKLFQELDTPGASDSTPMLKTVHTISRTYVVCLFALLMAWVAYPWMTGDLELPIPYWFPFNLDTFFKFSCAYSFASFVFFIICYTQDAVDTLLLLIAGQICRRLGAIRVALLSIGTEEPLRKRGWKRPKAMEDFMGLSILRMAALSRDETLLKEVIREHVDIIRLVRTFDIVLDDIFLAQVMQSTLVSTMTFFAVSKVDDPIKDMPKFMFILGATYLQFFMYCWLGEEISDHSDELHRTLYLSEWYKCREKIMKSLVIMETFTKAHFKLEGGHLFNIDLATFLMVILNL
ncbi:uncharacterized protein LOC112127668 [Cimex lectularius]|uniref:Odorant receptor n=1 Tax=Cimex lectularius TaxID=79782 RepID=A0A8I6SSG1_CIMLE|nr:uncharacterized protein LOC112127668 [Cimex lectularius]